MAFPIDHQPKENQSTPERSPAGGSPPTVPPSNVTRHTFSFPSHVRDAVRTYVRRAIEGLDPLRFRQEPAYTAALLARLEGRAYSGPDGSITLRATVVNAIGRNSAEKWSGADLAITAEIEQAARQLRKAILAQAKLGSLDDLSSNERLLAAGRAASACEPLSAHKENSYGKSIAGFFPKNPQGSRRKPAACTGITGQSSGRGLCVTPKVYQTTTS